MSSKLINKAIVKLALLAGKAKSEGSGLLFKVKGNYGVIVYERLQCADVVWHQRDTGIWWKVRDAKWWFDIEWDSRVKTSWGDEAPHDLTTLEPWIDSVVAEINRVCGINKQKAA